MTGQQTHQEKPFVWGDPSQKWGDPALTWGSPGTQQEGADAPDDPTTADTESTEND